MSNEREKTVLILPEIAESPETPTQSVTSSTLDLDSFVLSPSTPTYTDITHPSHPEAEPELFATRARTAEEEAEEEAEAEAIPNPDLAEFSELAQSLALFASCLLPPSVKSDVVEDDSRKAALKKDLLELIKREDEEETYLIERIERLLLEWRSVNTEIEEWRRKRLYEYKP